MRICIFIVIFQYNLKLIHFFDKGKLDLYEWPQSNNTIDGFWNAGGETTLGQQRNTTLPTVTQTQHERTPQLETIYPMTIFSPDKEAVQIRAAPQKLAQI